MLAPICRYHHSGGDAPRANAVSPFGETAPMIAIEQLTRTFGQAHGPRRRVARQSSRGSEWRCSGRTDRGSRRCCAACSARSRRRPAHVTVGGHRAGTFAARSLIGVSLAQERSFYLRSSGRENLILFARLRGLSRRAAAARVEELARELELTEIVGKRADRCSTGQLQQMAFARALLGEPPVLLLDEPTRSLDQEARGRVWEALDRRRERAVRAGEPSGRGHGVVRPGVPARGGARARWRHVIRYAVAASLARRDFEITRSYRTAFVLDLFWGAIEVLFYYFFSQIVGVSPDADLGGAPSYFAFALAGLMVSVVILSATIDRSRAGCARSS